MSSKTEKTKVSLEVPDELLREVADLAKENERSTSGEIRKAIREHVESSDS